MRKAHQQQFEQPVFMDDHGTVGTVLEEDNPPIIATEPDTSDSQRSVNFAAQAAGAVVLSKNTEAKGSKHLLNDDDDKYFMSPCSEPTFVVVGLSEDCIVQQLIISNYERYSSTVKDFLVLGSQAYPTKEWMVLGNFTAADEQGEQSFHMQARKVWVRYIKLQWRSHFRQEYYCTMTQIAVHGQTIMQDLHDVVSPPMVEPPPQLEAAVPTPLPPGSQSAPTAAAVIPSTLAETAADTALVGDPVTPLECLPPVTPWRRHLQLLAGGRSRTPARPPATQAARDTAKGNTTEDSFACQRPGSSWADHMRSLVVPGTPQSPHAPRGDSAPGQNHSQATPEPTVQSQQVPLTTVASSPLAAPAGSSSAAPATASTAPAVETPISQLAKHSSTPTSAMWPAAWASCAVSTGHAHPQWCSCLLHPRTVRPLLLHTAAPQAAQCGNCTTQHTMKVNVANHTEASLVSPGAGAASASAPPPVDAGAASASAPPPAGGAGGKQERNHSGLANTTTAPEAAHSASNSAPSSSLPTVGLAPVQGSEAIPPKAGAVAPPQPPPSPAGAPPSKGSPAQTLFKQLRSQVQDLELQQHALDAYLEDFRSAYDSLMGSVQTQLGNTSVQLKHAAEALSSLHTIIPHLQEQLLAHNISLAAIQARLRESGDRRVWVAGGGDGSEAERLQEDTLQFYALVVVGSCVLSVLSCLAAVFALCCR